jgi:hypothetical protein
VWGYIDRGGKFLIPAEFHGAQPFRNGIAVAWSEIGTFEQENVNALTKGQLRRVSSRGFEFEMKD